MTFVGQALNSRTAIHKTRGFALPTILISSIVMLIVLLASVSSTTAVRTAMKAQYYSQLAQVAGESGIAYAEACLNASAGIPTWSDIKPLTASTDCNGDQLAGFTCPTTSVDVRCSVTRNGNIRSNFNIGMPTLDSNGKAKTIANTGYVEVLRTSNSAVWRRYDQKTAPTAAVPDLCSGSAKSTLGWNNAVAITPNLAFPEPTSTTIGLTNVAVTPGPIFLRKDFSVTKAGTYTLQVKGDNYTETSVDGRLLSNVVYPAVGTTSADLGVGCHSLVVKLINYGVLSNTANLTLSLKLNGDSSPIVVSDTSWRVSAGNPDKHYSMVDYYADPAAWAAARDQGAYNGTATWGVGPVPDWATTSGVAGSRWIGTTNDYTAGSYPAGYALFRDSRTITVAASTQVKVSYACDNSCDVWLDGNKIVSSIAGWNVTQTVTVTLSKGSHKFGVALNNSAAGAAGFLFGALRTSDNAVLSLSDTNWKAANFWNAADQNPSSYDNSFTPNPPIDRGTSIGPDFSLWTLGGGATYSSVTKILTLPAAGTAGSPIVRVDRPTGIATGGDFFATTVSPYAPFVPKGGFLLGISYYGSDGTTPALNSSNYTANGCAYDINLSVWTLQDARCAFNGGPNVYYVSYSFTGSNGGYASPDLQIKNPLLRLNQ